MSEYAKRDHMQLDREGGHYSRHVSAMTAEGLHAKSDIAGELAFRDWKIAALTDRLDKAERENERLRGSIGMAYGYLWCVNNEPGTPHQYPPERAAYEARKLLRETMTSEQRGTFINRAVALVRGKRPMPLPSTAIDAARAAERGKE